MFSNRKRKHDQADNAGLGDDNNEKKKKKKSDKNEKTTDAPLVNEPVGVAASAAQTVLDGCEVTVTACALAHEWQDPATDENGKKKNKKVKKEKKEKKDKKDKKEKKEKKKDGAESHRRVRTSCRP